MKIASGLMLALLLAGLLVGAFEIKPVKATGTIYIRADGSIDPPAAPITTVDNVTYTFTGDIYDSVVVERDSIVVDGAGYTVTGSGSGKGITLVGRSNVTVRNMTIKNFEYGIWLYDSSNNTLCGNNVANNEYGIWLYHSSDNNVLSGNNVTANSEYGIRLYYFCHNNVLSGNNVANNEYGIMLDYVSSDNVFYHNNFINNTQHVYNWIPEFVNSWDDGYPNGGNYWSGYAGVDFFSGPYQNETGNDGIVDAPYVIDAYNMDRYPLMKPWNAHDIGITGGTTSRTVVGKGSNVTFSIMVFNYGNSTENFNLTAYANTTVIYTATNLVLAGRNFTVIGFSWNTSDFARAYTISANVAPVEGEVDLSDNAFVLGTVKVSCIGDINGDYVTDAKDYQLVKNAIPSMPGGPKWNPNADINDDGVIGVKDYQIVKSHIPSQLP